MTPPAGYWTQPADLLADVRRAWDKGHVLSDLMVGPEQRTRFPRRLRIAGPDKALIAESFGSVVAWSHTWTEQASGAPWQLETRRVPVRHLGPQQLPARAVVPDPEAALLMLGEPARVEADLYRDLWEQTGRALPQVLPVLRARPFEVVSAADDWAALLAVASWLAAHPRPGVHIREIPVPGAHSKLVESHRGLLGRMLDLVVPAEAVDAAADTLEGRFGLSTSPSPVWVRGHGALVGLPHLEEAEVAWPADALTDLDPARHGIEEVLVVENRRCLTTAPLRRGRLVVFGVGNRASASLLAGAWLGRVRLLYWGDLDTHGLLILSRVRAVQPSVASVLMDVDTLQAHRHRAVVEDSPVVQRPAGLTLGESQLWDALAAEPGLRIEQEHLSPDWVVTALG